MLIFQQNKLQFFSGRILKVLKAEVRILKELNTAFDQGYECPFSFLSNEYTD